MYMCIVGLYLSDIVVLSYFSNIGSAASEQPEPIQLILIGNWTICLMNASSATVLLHCV